MDLPTYTNIWRIEKRLYKLYDFRLPMPLPINWIAVFAGITIPYILLLIAIGLPFNHTLVWLYVLPPGVLTWATTRPVLESKRLPELVESQVRYLTEPRTWVRLTPLSEKNQVVLTAQRLARPPEAPGARHAPGARRAPGATLGRAGEAGQRAAPSAWAGPQAHLDLPAGTRPGRHPGTARPPAPGLRRAAAGEGTGAGPWSGPGARSGTSPGQGQVKKLRARAGHGAARARASAGPPGPAGRPRLSGDPRRRAGAVRPARARHARRGTAGRRVRAADDAAARVCAEFPAGSGAPGRAGRAPGARGRARAAVRARPRTRAGRAGRPGGARLEVSHDGPRRRQGNGQAPSARPATPSPAEEQVPPGEQQVPRPRSRCVGRPAGVPVGRATGACALRAAGVADVQQVSPPVDAAGACALGAARVRRRRSRPRLRCATGQCPPARCAPCRPRRKTG